MKSWVDLRTLLLDSSLIPSLALWGLQARVMLLGFQSTHGPVCQHRKPVAFSREWLPWRFSTRTQYHYSSMCLVVMVVFGNDERSCAWMGREVAPGKLEKQEVLFCFKCWLFCVTWATVYYSCCTGEEGSGWVMHPDEWLCSWSDGYTLCQTHFHAVCGLDITFCHLSYSFNATSFAAQGFRIPQRVPKFGMCSGSHYWPSCRAAGSEHITCIHSLTWSYKAATKNSR